MARTRQRRKIAVTLELDTSISLPNLRNKLFWEAWLAEEDNMAEVTQATAMVIQPSSCSIGTARRKK